MRIRHNTIAGNSISVFLQTSGPLAWFHWFEKPFTNTKEMHKLGTKTRTMRKDRSACNVLHLWKLYIYVIVLFIPNTLKRYMWNFLTRTILNNTLTIIRKYTTRFVTIHINWISIHALYSINAENLEGSKVQQLAVAVHKMYRICYVSKF